MQLGEGLHLLNLVAAKGAGGEGAGGEGAGEGR
jgi:hypothetical protein